MSNQELRTYELRIIEHGVKREETKEIEIHEVARSKVVEELKAELSEDLDE